MNRFGLLLALILAIGLGTVIAVPSSPGNDQNKINQLITKLGSDNFRERDAATKELDAIGEPALEALRKAAKSTDMEVANRAAALVTKIAQRGENARLVAPTYVELNLKEATIEDAVAELSKKSGYAIIVAGDKTRMSDRRVSLETGRVPFWKALDMLCVKAGLVEADANTPLPPSVDLPVAPLPPQVQPLPIRIQPIKINPINVKPIQIRPLPAKPVEDKPEKPIEDKPAPKPEKPVDPKPAVPQGFSAEAPVQREVPPQRAEAQPVPQPVAPAVLPVQAQPIQPWNGRTAPGIRANNGSTIVLVDGKARAIAADLESAFRIRAINDANLMGSFGPIPEGEIGMLLEVRAEPKIQVQQLLGVKIEKAVDNHDQLLTPTMVSSIGGVPNGSEVDQIIQLKQLQIQAQGQVQIQIGGGRAYNPVVANGNNYVPTRLKKGDKEPKSLKEVRGTISLKMRTGNEELVAIENILKAKGESMKGNGDSVLKVLDVSKAENGEITVQVELQFSNEVQPQVNQPVSGIAPPAINGNIRIQIAPAQPAPVPPQGAPAPAVAPRPGVYNYLGLDMVDAKGESLQIVKMLTAKNQWMNNSRSVSTTLVFKPQKDQEASKLAFRGSRAATVDVPFLLKDVPLK